jgi:metal-responsive CopG/Arc/MetJ family transcriptional regulator
MPETAVRARGRPAVGERVAVRLPPDVLEDVDRRARILGRSRASVIRSMLDHALQRAPEPDDGVDRAQIRRMLRLSPRERIEHMENVAAQQRRARGRARRR